MPVTFRAPEPVRFDVDPPEDWEPSLRSQEEVDALFWDQLLNKGKRGVNWLADQLFGRTAEEEFETAMVEFANPLISLVPRKTLKELLRRVQSRAGLEPGAEASIYRVPRAAPPGSLLERWRKSHPEKSRPERIYRREDDEIIPVPEDTVLHEAARWVSERYPRMMSHVADATVDPRLKGYGQHGGEVLGHIKSGWFDDKVPEGIRENLQAERLGRLFDNPTSEWSPSATQAPFSISLNPRFSGRSARLNPDNPKLTETAEAIDILTHELTHGGQHLRHGSRQRDVLARDDWAENYVPFRATPEGESYWRAPAERRAHTAGLANQLHYLMDERRVADPGVVSVIDEAIAGVIENRIPNTPGIGAYGITSLTEAASEGPAALRREIQRIAREATDTNMTRGFEIDEAQKMTPKIRELLGADR